LQSNSEFIYDFAPAYARTPKESPAKKGRGKIILLKSLL